MDGVVVMRPRTAWAQSRHLLGGPVGPFRATFADLAPALRELSQPLLPRRFRSSIDNASLATPAGLRTNVFPPSTPRPELAPYAVAFGGGTLLDALNAMVRGHDTTGWLLRYCGAPATAASATLGVGIHEDTLGRGRLIALADANGHADPCLDAR